MKNVLSLQYSTRQNKNVKTGGKVIVFSTIEQATTFKNQFIQYSIMRMMHEDFLSIGEVMMTERGLEVKELTAESGIKDEDTILFENLK